MKSEKALDFFVTPNLQPGQGSFTGETVISKYDVWKELSTIQDLGGVELYSDSPVEISCVFLRNEIKR